MPVKLPGPAFTAIRSARPFSGSAWIMGISRSAWPRPSMANAPSKASPFSKSATEHASVAQSITSSRTAGLRQANVLKMAKSGRGLRSKIVAGSP